MLVKTYGSAVEGIHATIITVEVNVASGGQPGFFLVGLPDNAVREGRERIRTSFVHNGFYLPRRAITVNMAPADIIKVGSAYDLTVAVGVLAADGTISPKLLESYLIKGELSLDGTLRPIKGALPIAIEARKRGFKGMIVPAPNAAEAAIVSELDVIPVENLLDAVEFLDERKTIEPLKRDTREIFFAAQERFPFDFVDVRGQENVKRALEVAAAGGHNIIMIGPPGDRKTMNDKRWPTHLTPLT